MCGLLAETLQSVLELSCTSGRITADKQPHQSHDATFGILARSVLQKMSLITVSASAVVCCCLQLEPMLSGASAVVSSAMYRIHVPWNMLP